MSIRRRAIRRVQFVADQFVAYSIRRLFLSILSYQLIVFSVFTFNCHVIVKKWEKSKMLSLQAKNKLKNKIRLARFVFTN